MSKPSKPSRRSVLLSAGSVGAVALGSKVAMGEEASFRMSQQQDEKDWPTPMELLKKMKTTQQALNDSALLPSRDLVPVAHADDNSSNANQLEAKVFGIYDGTESLMTLGLSWTCLSDKINLLNVGGEPFRARRFAFNVRNISWKAGNGWPVYTSYCPRNDYGDMYYRHAKVHQIVPSIRGQNYFTGCHSSAIAQSSAAGQVAFAVNDGGSHYRDNRGTFQVVITDWS